MPNSPMILSNEVQEIISNKPAWIIRYGMVFFLVVILAAVGSGYFIKYPYIVPIKAKIIYEDAPGRSKVYYAEIVVPQTNLNRIAVGQRVVLRLTAYPASEFGPIYGRIGFISRSPTDSGYAVKILLPDGLTTSHSKKIEYKNDLSAQGEIVVRDRTLLQRIVGIIRP